MTSAGNQPIGDDEVLYRRIPVSMNWCEGPLKPISPDAFRPTSQDDTGLSLGRALLLNNSPENEAAKGKNAKGYYVVEVRASEVRAEGMEVVPKPLTDDPSHAEITSLRYENRKEQKSEEWKVALAEMASGRTIHGPFKRASEATTQPEQS